MQSTRHRLKALERVLDVHGDHLRGWLIIDEGETAKEVLAGVTTPGAYFLTDSASRLPGIWAFVGGDGETIIEPPEYAEVPA